MLAATEANNIKKEFKHTLELGLPLVISQLIYASSSFISTALVARLGQDALAASVLVSVLWTNLSVLFLGILNSVGVLISHQYSAKNDAEISKIMGQGFLLGILVTILLLITLAISPLILRWSHQPAHVLKLSIDYTYSLLWLTPALVMLMTFEQFLAAANRTKLVLRISLFIVPIEILLIYSLIFGKFGFPKCGISGIGYGFAITYTITAIGLVIYLIKSNKFKRYRIFSHILSLDIRRLKELISLGLPMGSMHLIEVSTFTLMTFWISYFGTEILAAHQIAFQYLSFTINLIFAASQTVTIRVGYAIGKQNLNGIKNSFYAALTLSCIFSALIALAFYLIPSFFIQLDIDVSNAKTFLIKNAALLLAISGILQLIDTVRIIGIGALQGLKDTRFLMLASFISFWIIGLLCSYLFGFVLHWGGPGIWCGLIVGVLCGACIIIFRLQYLLPRINLQGLLSKSTLET